MRNKTLKEKSFMDLSDELLDLLNTNEMAMLKGGATSASVNNSGVGCGCDVDVNNSGIGCGCKG